MVSVRPVSFAIVKTSGMILTLVLGIGLLRHRSPNFFETASQAPSPVPPRLPSVAPDPPPTHRLAPSAAPPRDRHPSPDSRSRASPMRPEILPRLLGLHQRAVVDAQKLRRLHAPLLPHQFPQEAVQPESPQLLTVPVITHLRRRLASRPPVSRSYAPRSWHHLLSPSRPVGAVL